MWDRRADLARLLAGQPTADLDRRGRIDLLDLGIPTAHLTVRAAPAEVAARHRALDILAEAEAVVGRSDGLDREKAVHLTALGRPVPTDLPPPSTAWELRPPAGRSWRRVT